MKEKGRERERERNEYFYRGIHGRPFVNKMNKVSDLFHFSAVIE